MCKQTERHQHSYLQTNQTTLFSSPVIFLHCSCAVWSLTEGFGVGGTGSPQQTAASSGAVLACSLELSSVTEVPVELAGYPSKIRTGETQLEALGNF